MTLVAISRAIFDFVICSRINIAKKTISNPSRWWKLAF